MIAFAPRPMESDQSDKIRGLSVSSQRNNITKMKHHICVNVKLSLNVFIGYHCDPVSGRARLAMTE